MKKYKRKQRFLTCPTNRSSKIIGNTQYCEQYREMGFCIYFWRRWKRALFVQYDSTLQKNVLSLRFDLTVSLQRFAPRTCLHRRARVLTRRARTAGQRTITWACSHEKMLTRCCQRGGWCVLLVLKLMKQMHI